MTRRWISFAMVLGACALARAHDPGISSVQGQVTAKGIELVTGFAPADAQQFVPAESRTSGRSMTPAEFVAVSPLLEAVAPDLWEVRVGDVALTPSSSQVRLLPGDSVSFTLTFPRPAGGGRLTLRAAKLSALPPGHRQFVIIGDEQGSTIAKKLLSAKDDTMDLSLAGTFRGFIWLGVGHIWTGYDHLLFLFALLVVCRTFKSIVAIITCFTLAHSLTLALATLNIVNLPSRITEPAIAASIIYVGVENLLRRGAEPKGRWALTFVFGLIHGFGFASVLRELGVGEGGTGIAMPLFTFNAGVEVGQVAIAAIVLPIVWRLRKNEKFVTHGVPALSAVVTVAGLYWFLERTVFG